MDTSPSRWHPIASSADLPYRHVFHAQLLGREFAVWRADDGYVNVWENRCVHRGLRLSVGINDGRELKCQYHGWRYANRTAGCTYIPAHPADAPARTITNRTYAASERYGLVWSCEEPLTEVPHVAALEGSDTLVLRPIPLSAPPGLVVERLKDYRFCPNGQLEISEAEVSIEAEGFLSVTLRARAKGEKTVAVFLVQPVDSNRAVIRGVVDLPPLDQRGRIAVLRHHSELLSSVGEKIEREASLLPEPEPLRPSIKPIAAELAEMPALSASGRKAAVRVQVTRKWPAAEGIAAFELRPLKGLLPTFQPGAHIDVHMPNSEIRQYSIINGPGQSDSYIIGVKREADSQGGSSCMHDRVSEGDVLAISLPRNNFPLRRDALKTLLVAGGIGITPLLSMAQTLHHSALPYELHYFARDKAHLAFTDRLKGLGDNLRVYLGLDAEATGTKLRELVSSFSRSLHLYFCGPGAMIEVARNLAAERGWPDEAVHYEYFKNTNKIDDRSSFEVALARSAVTLDVPAGKTILQVMRENGIDMPSSCEQGACGTCIAAVIEGVPDHQDVYLNQTERRSGTKIMTCVSRAKSARLVLDI